MGNAADDETTGGISSRFEGLRALDDKERKSSLLVPSLDELGKRFDERFQALQNSSSKIISTETSTTTTITRNPLRVRSVYKETVTTEKLPDGTTKASRSVDTTPANDPYQSRTERTVNTSPAKNTAMRWGDSVLDGWRTEDAKGVKKVKESADAGKKKEASRPNDSTWRFGQGNEDVYTRHIAMVSGLSLFEIMLCSVWVDYLSVVS
jgi:hypothetical protein